MIAKILLEQLIADATLPMLDVEGNCKYGDTYFSHERFAQLIARECSDLCMEEYRTMDGWGRTSADTRCSKLICETFDIKLRWI